MTRSRSCGVVGSSSTVAGMCTAAAFDVDPVPADTVRDGGRDHLGRHFAAFRRDVSLYFRLPTARRTQTYEIEYSLFFSANPGSGRDFSFRTTPFPKNIAFAVQPPVRTRKIRSAKSGIVLDPLFQWEN